MIRAPEPTRILRSLLLSHLNLTSVSPFITTGPVSPLKFFGRERELRMIADQAGNTSFVVVGGRRIGKSSMLRRLYARDLFTKGFSTLYFDCSITATVTDFKQANLPEWLPRRPADSIHTFGDLLSAPPLDHRIVLLLDEADKLIPADQATGWTLFNEFRALINSGRAQMVLSGERVLNQALQDATSPLYNFANKILLGPLDFGAVKELVTQPLKELEIELVDEHTIISRIWSFTSGHPNIVQRLCKRLIEGLDRQGIRRITLDDVIGVVEDPTFQRDDFLSTFWENMTYLEKIISLLMADEESVRTLATVRETLERRCDLRPRASEVDRALQHLVELRSILRRSPTGYEFAVEAFPRVVAGTMTLSDMLEVLVEDYEEQAE